MPRSVCLGVDVGTGSVRVACLTLEGELLAHHIIPLTVHNPEQEHYEQNSQEIWETVCKAAKVRNTLIDA